MRTIVLYDAIFYELIMRLMAMRFASHLLPIPPSFWWRRVTSAQNYNTQK